MGAQSLFFSKHHQEQSEICFKQDEQSHYQRLQHDTYSYFYHKYRLSTTFQNVMNKITNSSFFNSLMYSKFKHKNVFEIQTQTQQIKTHQAEDGFMQQNKQIIEFTYQSCTGCTVGTEGGNCGTRPSLCPWGSLSPVIVKFNTLPDRKFVGEIELHKRTLQTRNSQQRQLCGERA